MAPRIEFPAIDTPTPRVMLYATARPDWQPDAIQELARRFGVSGEPSDQGPWHIVRDERATLEVYQASHSLRFTRVDLDAEGRDSDGGGLGIDRGEAVRIADDWVSRFGPAGSRSEVFSVTEQELLVSERRGSEPRRIVGGLQVNYRFSLDGLPLLGPGAKMQVTVGRGGEVVSAYRFWREPRAQSEVATVPVDRAFARFRASALFAGLPDAASAAVESVRMGHLCLPPTEVQSLLVPAYELRGVLRTETDPRYEFVRYVAAAELNESDTKRQRLVNTRPAVLIT